MTSVPLGWVFSGGGIAAVGMLVQASFPGFSETLEYRDAGAAFDADLGGPFRVAGDVNEGVEFGE
ncbi:hypothetical protein A5701_14470 [Mycobacterium sp. E3305]|nr:hypothetical protein A5701_14470 [Mycobacterium sp. E3305]